ncbi:MAG: hypothetical protein V1772_04580 [Chloroflexota bacterium]
MREPRFETREAFTVLGVEDDAIKMDTVDPGFHDLWMRRFMPHHGEVSVFSTDGAYYAVWFGMVGDLVLVGTHLAGMAVRPEAVAPEGWVIRQVPAARYAVFDTTLRDVGDGPEYALHRWLPGSGYALDGDKPRFDLMPPDTSGPESPVTVWIPVVRRAT